MKNPAMKYMELSEHQIKDTMTNVQHQIQADRSGKIWINVSNNDPRLNINGIVARIRPVYNHTVFARQNEIIVDSPSKIQQAILIALFNGKHPCCVMGGIDGIHNTHCKNF